MYLIPTDEVEKILMHVEAAFPREASGLLLRREFKQFTLLSVVGTPIEENTPLSFRIRGAGIKKIAESLRGSGTRTCGCFHSHVVGGACPSRRDCAARKEPGDLWLIYSVRFRNLNLFRWDGKRFKRERFLIIPSLSTP